MGPSQVLGHSPSQDLGLWPSLQLDLTMATGDSGGGEWVDEARGDALRRPAAATPLPVSEKRQAGWDSVSDMCLEKSMVAG